MRSFKLNRFCTIDTLQFLLRLLNFVISTIFFLSIHSYQMLQMFVVLIFCVQILSNFKLPSIYNSRHNTWIVETKYMIRYKMINLSDHIFSSPP